MFLLSHLASCTPNKCSLYLANSPSTVEIDPHLYRLPTFHVPQLTFLFYRLVLPKDQSWSQVHYSFCTKATFYGEGLLEHLPNRSWRTTPYQPFATAFSLYSKLPFMLEAVLFLHPQSEHAPCRGDRDPRILVPKLHHTHVPMRERVSCSARENS
jgi:hypothetical protein